MGLPSENAIQNSAKFKPGSIFRNVKCPGVRFWYKRLSSFVGCYVREMSLGRFESFEIVLIDVIVFNGIFFFLIL